MPVVRSGVRHYGDEGVGDGQGPCVLRKSLKLSPSEVKLAVVPSMDRRNASRFARSRAVSSCWIVDGSQPVQREDILQGLQPGRGAGTARGS